MLPNTAQTEADLKSKMRLVIGGHAETEQSCDREMFISVGSSNVAEEELVEQKIAKVRRFLSAQSSAGYERLGDQRRLMFEKCIRCFRAV